MSTFRAICVQMGDTRMSIFLGAEALALAGTVPPHAARAWRSAGITKGLPVHAAHLGHISLGPVCSSGTLRGLARDGVKEGLGLVVAGQWLQRIAFFTFFGYSGLVELGVRGRDIKLLLELLLNLLVGLGEQLSDGSAVTSIAALAATAALTLGALLSFASLALALCRLALRVLSFALSIAFGSSLGSGVLSSLAFAFGGSLLPLASLKGLSAFALLRVFATFAFGAFLLVAFPGFANFAFVLAFAVTFVVAIAFLVALVVALLVPLLVAVPSLSCASTFVTFAPALLHTATVPGAICGWSRFSSLGRCTPTSAALAVSVRTFAGCLAQRLQGSRATGWLLHGHDGWIIQMGRCSAGATAFQHGQVLDVLSAEDNEVINFTRGRDLRHLSALGAE
mmetsp:Transcript_33807/g.78566  ORF Transcript_33807/g.78566 Transcript_33807/m.78566 type:complete len:395 (+) Transcript_33807:73-1257(+)